MLKSLHLFYFRYQKNKKKNTCDLNSIEKLWSDGSFCKFILNIDGPNCKIGLILMLHNLIAHQFSPQAANATVLLNATKEIVQLKTSQPTVTVTKRKISQSTTIIQKSSTPKLSPIPKPEKRDFFECPNTSHFEIFSSYCTNHTNCRNSGENFRCCKQYGSKRCVKGVFKPLKEQRHERM